MISKLAPISEGFQKVAILRSVSSQNVLQILLFFFNFVLKKPLVALNSYQKNNFERLFGESDIAKVRYFLFLFVILGSLS